MNQEVKTINGYNIKDEIARNNVSKLSDFVDKKSSSLVCNIDYRDCTEWINGITDETNDIIGYVQGMTTTDTSIILAYQTGGSNQDKSNMILLREVSKDTKEIIKEKWLELGHANSIAYNKQASELYVAKFSYVDNEENLQYSNQIIIIDYDTFNIKSTVVPNVVQDNDYIRSVSYDNKNKILSVGNLTTVYILENWNTVSETITLDNSYTSSNVNPLTNSNTIQNTIVYDNYIYCIKYFPNGILVYDLEGNIVRNNYNFDLDLPIDMGELESISIEPDGTIYLASVQEVISPNNVAKLYDITVFKSNLKYNGFKNYSYSGVTTSTMNYYVDSNTTNKIQAGTSSLPFKHIEQAIMSSQFQSKNVNVTINLVGTNKSYGFIVSKTDTNLNILGNDNYIYLLDLQETKAKFENLIIDCTTLANIGSVDIPTNVRIYNHSDVIFNNCEFINTDETQKDNAIVSIYSDVKAWNCSFSNFVNIFRMLNFSNVKVSSLTTTNCDYYYHNVANAKFYMSDNTLLTKQNPESQKSNELPSIWQNLQYTFSNGTLTLDDINLDTINSPYRKLQITIKSNLDSNDYRSIQEFSTGNTQPRCYVSFINADNSIKYDVFFNFAKSSQGIWTITQKVLKNNVTNGNVTDITSNSSFTIEKLVRQ